MVRVALEQHELQPAVEAITLWGGRAPHHSDNVRFGVWQIYLGIMGSATTFGEVPPNTIELLREILQAYNHHTETLGQHLDREAEYLVDVRSIQGRAVAQELIEHGKIAGTMALEIAFAL